MAPELTGITGDQTKEEKFRRLQSTTMVAALVLFFLSAIWGIYAGYQYGKSKATYQSVSHLYDALNFYYQDQGRYPSADQLYNQSILTAYNYIGNLPKPDDATGKCSEYKDFIYTQSKPSDFSLQFCLLKPVGGYSSGLNVITEDKSK